MKKLKKLFQWQVAVFYVGLAITIIMVLGEPADENASIGFWLLLKIGGFSVGYATYRFYCWCDARGIEFPQFLFPENENENEIIKNKNRDEKIN